MAPASALDLANKTIAVTGFSCVGLTRALQFRKQRPVVGFDINPTCMAALRSGHNHTQAGSCGTRAWVNG